MCCFLMFDSSLQTKYRKNINKPLKKKAIKYKPINIKILKLNEDIDDLIKNRHVVRRGYFDNMLCFIKKNSKEVHPYYVIQCQYRQLEKYKKCLKLRHPSMKEAGRCDDPNAIHR